MGISNQDAMGYLILVAIPVGCAVLALAYSWAKKRRMRYGRIFFRR